MRLTEIDTGGLGVGRFGGKGALIAGAACGQGRSHAVRPVSKGAGLIVVTLGGVRHTIAAAAPHLIEQEAGGAITITSSTQGLTGAARTGSGT